MEANKTITSAVIDDCHAFSGNQEALSIAVTGKSYALRHKISGHKGSVLSLTDAISVMEVTGGRNTIKVIAEMLGGLYIDMPDDLVDAGNEELMIESQAIMMRLADLFAEHSRAVKDGVVTADEQEKLNKLKRELFSQVKRFLLITDKIYGVTNE